MRRILRLLKMIKASHIIRHLATEIPKDNYGWPIGLRRFRRIRGLNRILETRHVLVEKDFTRSRNV